MKHRTTHLEAVEDVPIAERLAALAEGDRLRMLRVLEREELSVGEVAQVMQQPQSTVSRRLKILTESGWLRRRSVGTSAFYALVQDDLPESARRLWTTVRQSLDDDPQTHDDLLRLQAVLASRHHDSQAFFGRVVGEWDTIRTELFGAGFTPPALLGLLDPSWVVADIGCGTGNAPEHLASHVRRVIAVDQSQPMLEAAAKRLARFDNVEFRLGDAASLPIEDRAVDAVVCVLVLHHLDTPELALREMRRVLKPGGVALLVDMTAHQREEFRAQMGHRRLGIAADEMIALLDGAGFTEARVSALPVAPGARGPSLFVATARTPSAASTSNK
ncbi:MAG: metalloregulator ArsR/SmtB family transcription factor [Phycisphaeraceae bacterium]|nr:metalloregulator ArsR/SmtB family transcription factor [Phycisphaeraceae bacterium]